MDSSNSTFLFELEEMWSKKEEAKYATKERLDASFEKMMNKRKAGPEERNHHSAKAPSESEPAIQHRHIPLFFKVAASLLLIVSVGLGTLYYTEMTRPVKLNTVIVPHSQTTQLLLGDGTEVWLNAGSRFSYPSNFSRNDRHVKLEGEALFHVAHDADKPFIVHTHKLDIRVLGTLFNVKSHLGENTSVTLKEGIVEVNTEDRKTIRMKPNQLLTYSPDSGISTLREVDASMAGLWVIGEFMFAGETLKTIVAELKRRFNRDIIIEDESLEDKRFFCHAHKDATLTEILDLLKDSGQLTYIQHNRSFIIRKEGK